VLELAKIEACELSDLLKTVNERISVYKELSRSLGNVEVILEETLNSHKSFAIERFKATLLKYLLQEHLTEKIGRASV
jgi:hypothetical protein